MSECVCVCVYMCVYTCVCLCVWLGLMGSLHPSKFKGVPYLTRTRFEASTLTDAGQGWSSVCRSVRIGYSEVLELRVSKSLLVWRI